MSNSKAMLIGIDYFNSPNNSLPGCINDIIDIRNMLIVKYNYLPENIVMLCDIYDQDPNLLPTKANILSNFTSIIQTSSKCDEIWIHYSGHGSRIFDRLNQLEDIIVPSDYKNAGLITSHDIFEILKNSECPTITVFDCCNSASICGLPWAFTFDISLNVINSLTQHNSTIIKNPNIFELSGSNDNQTSSDVYDITTGKYNGLLTRTLIKCLTNYNYTCSITELYIDICKTILESGYTQNPILSSSSKNLNYMFTNPLLSINKSVITNVSVTAKPKVVMKRNKLIYTS